jgi:hypothetical protein
LHQPSVRKLRDRRERVVGAVHDQLGPERASDVVRDLDLDVGAREGGDDRFAALAASDQQLAAPVVADMARAGHLDRDIDHRGDHLASERRREPLRIVDAVLQREDGRLALEVRRQRLAGSFGVGGFHRKEHEPRAARSVGCAARIEFYEFIELTGLQA